MPEKYIHRTIENKLNEMNSSNGIGICLTRKMHVIDEKNYMKPIEYI